MASGTGRCAAAATGGGDGGANEGDDAIAARVQGGGWHDLRGRCGCGIWGASQMCSIAQRLQTS